MVILIAATVPGARCVGRRFRTRFYYSSRDVSRGTSGRPISKTREEAGLTMTAGKQVVVERGEKVVRELCFPGNVSEVGRRCGQPRAVTRTESLRTRCPQDRRRDR